MTIYTNCQIEFCAIGNIHAMRNSVDKLYDTIHSPLTSETNWFGLLQETKWLEYIRLLLASGLIFSSFFSLLLFHIYLTITSTKIFK